MNICRLPLSFAKCLLLLVNNKPMNASDIKSKSFLKDFLELGLLSSKKITPQRYVYYCKNSIALLKHLEVQYEIICLKSYIDNFNSNLLTGENSLVACKSTKTFRHKSLQGFFIRAYNTSIKYKDNSLDNISDGLEYFVHNYSLLSIDDDVLVVGIENPECFTQFNRLLHLFNTEKIVCIMRYLSKSPNSWLQTIDNKYLHFGDFDLAGINIYINEYASILCASRCSFFIPDNINELLIKYGSNSLYNRQLDRFNDLPITNDLNLLNLIGIIKYNKKALEQERLLVFDI